MPASWVAVTPLIWVAERAPIWVVVNALKQRVADQAGVNVDQEMANLLTLQTAYAANARVMSARRSAFHT